MMYFQFQRVLIIICIPCRHTHTALIVPRLSMCKQKSNGTLGNPVTRLNTHTHTHTQLLLLYHLHCKNRLVVLTGEWLPWLHGLLCTIGQLYKTTSFLVVSSSFLYSEMRKSGGNNEETTSLVVLYNYQTKT